MSLTIVNAGNVYAKHFLRTVKGFDKIVLGDIYNSRSGLLRLANLQRETEKKEITNININSQLLLEQSIRNSKTVVYFTHDYFRLVTDKNTQLRQTADICKAYDVDKLICVCPIEFDNYYTAGGIEEDPIKEFNKSRDYALDTFKRTTFIRTNMIFGSKSYLVKYLIQNWLGGIEVFDAEKYGNYRFNPLYFEDLADVVTQTLNEEFHGKKLYLSGKDSVSYLDMNNLIKQEQNKVAKYLKAYKMYQKAVKNYNLIFHGNNHVINMESFLDYFNNNTVNFDEYENLLKLINYQPKFDFKKYYLDKNNEESMNEYIEPYFDRYLKNSLN